MKLHTLWYYITAFLGHESVKKNVSTVNLPNMERWGEHVTKHSTLWPSRKHFSLPFQLSCTPWYSMLMKSHALQIAELSPQHTSKMATGVWTIAVIMEQIGIICWKPMVVLCMRNAAVGKHLVSKSATSRVPRWYRTRISSLRICSLTHSTFTSMWRDRLGRSMPFKSFKLDSLSVKTSEVTTFEVTTKSFILNDLRIRETILLKTKLSWQIVCIPVISLSHADREMDCWCREYDLMRAPKKVKTPPRYSYG